jgi:hypothetical protein
MGVVPQGAVSAGMASDSISGSDVLCGAATTPGSSVAMSLGSPGPFLPGSSDCVSPSTNWRRVEGEAQHACS